MSGFSGSDRWVWGPEGWDEADLDLLQPQPGLARARAGVRCRRWQPLASVTGGHGRWASTSPTGCSSTASGRIRRLDAQVPVVQAHAGALPFGDTSFDLVATAYGALPFVADADRVLAEVRRVLVPGGRLVFAVTHPIRWAFPDDPGPRGLTAARSYFDRTPYAETDDSGQVRYVEHHRTVGDWVDLVVGAGLRLDRLVEPPWNPDNSSVWGGWSALRGALLPGTLIVVAHKPAEPLGQVSTPDG